MDMFCCGMYRSCSTWQYDVAQAILRSESFNNTGLEVEACGYLTGPEYAEFRRATRSRGVIRLFKGHEGHPSYTRAMFRGRAVGLYAHRDVRDVLFSLMFKRRQTFQEILKTGMVHQILVNDRFWRLHPQRHRIPAQVPRLRIAPLKLEGDLQLGSAAVKPAQLADGELPWQVRGH